MTQTLELTHSDQINEIAAALAKAQGAMKPAVFNRINPHYKNKYADFSSCMEACRIPLSENGIAVMQYPVVRNEKFFLVTMLAHQSGQWIKSEFPISTDKKTIQGIGSEITYAKRYTLCGIVGIVSDEDVENDDDGEAAVRDSQKKEPKEEEKKTLTKAQCDEIKPLWENTEKSVKDNIKNTLESLGIKTLSGLPKESFEYYKNLLLKHQIQNLTEGLENG